MIRSLYSGVAGLRTHQTKMDVLGNNIANVNTTSFKSQSITFSDLMYQTTQTASGATETKGGVNARQIGLGAKSGAINTQIEGQGATQTTNNPFDIMITGKAFFVVNNGKENLYTRDGSFYVDGAGNLAMQSNGYFVQGWVAQEDKETGEIKVNKNGGLSALQIMSAENSTYSPASTTAGLYSGNIDDHDSNVVSDDGKTITMEFYDNKGYLYTGKFTLKDTGTDHLFSLQLTDIIDSEGNTIGSDLLQHVTFGDVTSSNPLQVAEGYTVTVVDNVATIKQDANSVKYTEVPKEGNLKDLMSDAYSSKTYKGVLEEAYSLTDDDVINELGTYYASATYSINVGTGELTITWVETDSFPKTQNFAYTTQVKESYYYKESTGLGYRVPANMTANTIDDLSKYDIKTFENVFKDSSGNAPTIDNTHTYTFTNQTTLTVSELISSISGEDSKTEKAASYFATDANKFTPTSNSPTGATLTNLNATDENHVWYTFDGTKITVYDSTVTSNDVEDTANKISTSSTNPIADPTNYAKETLFNLSDLSTILNSDGQDAVLNYFNTYTNLTDFINNSGYTKFAYTEATGTYGLVFYTTENSYTASDTKLYEGTVSNTTYTADLNTYSKKQPSEFTGTWYSISQGYDYLVRSDQKQVSEFSKEFMDEVFDIDEDTYDTYSATKNTVSFITTGMKINVTKEKTETANKDSAKVYPSYNEEKEYFEFLTKDPQTRWTVASSDMTGNITDLLQSSSGTYSGLLNTVYGISDDDARAYGTDGKYTINKDGTITLSTGDKTIQLVFNPANGSLTTANGSGTGLVNMVFDQTQPGLEAFGYQKQSTDGADAVLGRLTLDFSTVTNYNTNGSSTIKAVKGDKKSLNTGRAVGEMNGVTVSTDGQIFATYSNGQTKLLGQIASAEFANASGLSKEGDNLYASTLNSGEATIQDITTDGGYMNTGVLEMSNVDLSKEFTEMITTQRGFQANSRIITVSDTLLEELTNLKR